MNFALSTFVEFVVLCIICDGLVVVLAVVDVCECWEIVIVVMLCG